MQQLKVVYLRDSGNDDRRERPLFQKQSVGWNSLGFSPWSQAAGQPDVKFDMYHTGDKIYLKYLVAEKHIRAVNVETNSPVYEDSCVEFFIAFDSDDHYYNFEFNCLGTCLAGYGTGRADRKILSAETLDKISTESFIRRIGSGAVYWELSLYLPLAVFSAHDITNLRGRKCRANFYKCGDRLPEPHFLSWNDIQSPEPNFHLPSFFGEVIFE